ncbi:Two-component hybrid sensor and regulator [Polaromonas sp. CG9_12]|nr:Two-component hybrid sensor and regulator [Polaromonas sp. CG9_12]
MATPQQTLSDEINLKQLLTVLDAYRKGDFSARMPNDLVGLPGKVADTLNDIIDRGVETTTEFGRVAQLVGKQGKLDERIKLPSMKGSWAKLVDSSNALANDLVSPLNEMIRVVGAVAKGDLSQNVPTEIDGLKLQGQFLKSAQIVNTMVTQLGTFSSEVTRVAREVGTDGKLGGQAEVRGASGTWKDLTDNVNAMASNLTNQIRNVAEVTTAVAKGDLSKKITGDVKGEILVFKNTTNAMVDQLSAFASEVTRVAREVGTDGKLGGQAAVIGVAGTWNDLTENVNRMASNLTNQIRNVAEVTTAVAKGDLSKKITGDVKGEILVFKNTTNAMVDQLAAFASEVTRVAREVGSDGKLGGQAAVIGVAGTWNDLTENVNRMASNLTNQIRNVAEVTTAVAKGDLSKKITGDVKGEILVFKNTTNAMVDQLAAFASEVTRVAREVGSDGKLGGQAAVIGVAGTWNDLTENVNRMASNLTNQVRAIAEVVPAVTKGDFTRSVQVEAKGEVADLKDNVNQMIGALRETTRQNSEQDWLKTNLAKFTRLLQGQRDLTAVSKMVLSELAPLINAQHGVFYMMDETVADNPRLKFLSAYAFTERKNLANEWRVGEGLVGQCAYEKQRILLTNVPSDYIQITSGLGGSKPQNIVVLPIVFEDKVKAVIEIASFTLFSQTHQTFLDQLGESIGIVLNTIEANVRTEELLKQSQSLAAELQSQQEELRQTNEELEEKAKLLEDQKVEVEYKNRQIEASKLTLEEKAEELTLTSKYKSEFLSNMSHELRTPLNSLLILSQQLAENAEHNMSEQQIEYAKTIQGSGKDLLALINEILDLSKIESGTVTPDLQDVSFANVREQVERTFRHVAESRGLGFGVEFAPGLPSSLYTDSQRLQQVMKNLLSNAFKFTAKGQVSVRIEPVESGWSVDHDGLNRAQTVIGLYVTDTGIGLPTTKQKIIFEAFQQADTGTARKYGGTGLGLSISREIARLLGGELRLATSSPGKGSTFVLYLPLRASEPGQNSRGTPGGAPDSGKRQRLERDGESFAPKAARPDPAAQEVPEGRMPPATAVADDRAAIQPGDRTLLIVEDDARFADILLRAARDKGFKGIVAARGDDGIKLAGEFKPTAITLDLHLPDMDGWVVLERLKRNPDTRHIPVEIISAEDNRLRGLRYGAFEYLVKPVTAESLQKALADVNKFAEREVKDLLVADGDEQHLKNVLDLIGSGDVRIKSVASGKDALAALKKKRYDCIVLDLKLPDIPVADLLEAIQGFDLTRDVPVIIYGMNELPQQEQERLKSLALKGIIKEVRTPERLLDETALFLHRVVSKLPDERRQMLETLYLSADSLAGKKVLVVDDDVRNIFALTAVLERHKMAVIVAENGRAALEELGKNPDVHIVLMDLMMPEMDGFETMRQIRKMKQFESLPMIALTAKAMKGDREKCIEAGASDYVSKPVDTDQLLSLLRVWLYR